MSSATIGVLAATVALSVLAIPSHAAIEDGGLRPAIARTSDSSGIVLVAAAQERAAGGQRAGGARDAQGNRAGTTTNRQSATASRQVRSSATNNINHTRGANANVNRNVNANRDVDVNVHRDYYDGWDDHWHPVAAAAAVTATAMAVGAIVNSVPPSCSTVVVSGVSYSQCGSTWYRPQYVGTTLQYVVVSPPR